MNETSKEYILQWSGHAASITERFSGLLAKQALVDVTLICQEQKLRVHKLVLASCSFYFEEMLEQDLGQEPIILLKDLDFDILKAMVEFMYCGETTIAHCHLKPLLEAAHVFKVKDLESIVKCMMSTKNYIDDTDKSSKSDKDLSDTVSPIRNCVQVKLSGRESTEKSSTESSDNKISKSDQPAELEHTPPELKQTSVELGHPTLDNEHEAAIFYDMIESTNELATRSNENQSKNHFQRNVSNLKNFSLLNNKTNGDNQPQLANNNTILNDLSTNTDKEHEKTCSHKNKNLESNLDLSDLPSRVGECSKVYTYKKRKLTDCRKTALLNTSDLLTRSQPTDCIDLSDDLSCDTTPITLPSLALDMNATDKVWSLNTDNIHYIIGNTVNQTNALIRDRQRIIYEEIDGEKSIIPNHKSIRQIKELFSVDNDNISMGRTPILRRSVRLNQLETDDSVNNNHSNNNNNNNNEETQKIKDKHNVFKSLSKSLTKSKRKKESSTNGSVPDENTVSKKSVNNNSRSRNNKLTSKSAGSSRRLSKIKDEKSRSKFKKTVKMTKIESLDTDGCSPVKLNTIATVERALWGDMSDVMENHETATMIPEYSMSKEIPFAVGLLPLHAALERMQAMPDYQPRKTRSSFATPMKHEANCLKRKAGAVGGAAAISNNPTTTTTTTTTDYETTSNKKQSSLEQIVDNTSSTFCHIKIQTSSQCSSQSCDNSTTDHLVTIESNFHKR
ncbi:dual specificity protein kinase splB-like [Microplitis mediator]|uniref:dual specificity protein kinase splB-like n=1 Tax=Microplitis mediator TaxID=375433 RepID=UPI00255799E3|nr:dual specificity protein kinase splB-like [Microplitis mediator]XP_057321460.1 dual specificity protein kinase splB-like [Microplitis mediator]XP_057321461.1 dual specificity protein kinase splB-like [Microplitis mediator]